MIMNSIENDAQSIYLEELIRNTIQEVGVPSHIIGYEILCTAVLFVINDSSMIKSVSKFLYPSVAGRYRITASQVQRAITQAIEIASGRGNELFGHCFAGNSWLKPPTNRDFISKIADIVKKKIENQM